VIRRAGSPGAGISDAPAWANVGRRIVPPHQSEGPVHDRGDARRHGLHIQTSAKGTAMSLKHRSACGAAVVGAALVAAHPGAAQTTPSNSQIQSLQQQIQDMQNQLHQLQDQLHQVQQQPPAAAAATPPAAPSVPVAAGPNGIQIGGVNLKFGGFIEAAGIYRSRNEVSDVGSDFNTGLDFKNIVQTHEQEFRGSARQSRISGLVTGDVSADTHLAAYIESDFLGVGTASNSRESNSYVPRLRQAYSTVDVDNVGFHFLAGQSWSLLTTDTVGIIPRQEQIPLTIDAQYVPGFNWTRNVQARFVENFGHGVWAGLSFESPQAVLSPGVTANGNGEAVGTPNANNNGDSTGLLNNTTQYSNDVAPDVIAKVAVDPGFGHYELKGLGRIFSDRDLDRTHYTVGYGAGAAAIVPVLPRFLDFQLSGLAGHGIGRYGSGQLPDVAVAANGESLSAVPVFQALTGFVGHPRPGTDIFLYGGWEHADHPSSNFQGAAGYGFGGLNNTGCDIEGNANCAAQTKDIRQVVLGFWQDIFRGNFGRVVFGAEDSVTQRVGFTGIGGSPNVSEDIAMVSFRYYPF
jgi:hypothetical protein